MGLLSYPDANEVRPLSHWAQGAYVGRENKLAYLFTTLMGLPLM